MADRLITRVSMTTAFFDRTLSHGSTSLVARLIHPVLFTHTPSYFPGPVLAVIAPTTIVPELLYSGPP